MSETAIVLDGISKRYRIGRLQDRYRTIRGALSDSVRCLLRGGELFRGARSDDFIWALQDVSFAVRRGEVVGLIGPNGAGKTTLLKILSRITPPTRGRAEIRGRVGSLLEVGTGFHPELTGRENVYLSGAILGMKRREIDRKYDEIVAFSELEQFMDTPVKRYSSGMYVRLAFAVAAHLETEILLVDEVLAVGDVSFQKKCTGKMSQVASGGRTVLFVSHNLAAVESLCDRTLLLQAGKVVADGPTVEVIGQYLMGRETLTGDIDLTSHPGRPGEMRSVLRRLRLHDAAGRCVPGVGVGEDLILEISGYTEERLVDVTCGIRFMGALGQRVTTCHTRYQYPDRITLEGEFTLRCHMRNLRLMPGEYSLMLVLTAADRPVDTIEGIVLRINENDVYGTGKMLPPRCGPYVPEATWEVWVGGQG